MLHINIVGVVACSDNSTHITQFHCCNVSITLQDKKFNKMLSILVDNAAANEQLGPNCKYYIKFSTIEISVMSCIFMSCIFMPCNLVFGPSFSAPPPYKSKTIHFTYSLSSSCSHGHSIRSKWYSLVKTAEAYPAPASGQIFKKLDERTLFVFVRSRCRNQLSHHIRF